MRTIVTKSFLLALGLLVAAGIIAISSHAAPPAGGNQTGQGIMVNLHATGAFVITTDLVYQFNLATAATYYNNTLVGTDGYTGGGGDPAIIELSRPTGADVPAPLPSEVTQQADFDWRIFGDGGALRGHDYSQKVTVSNVFIGNDKQGRPKYANITYAWLYEVTGDGTVEPLTAYDPVEPNVNDTAHLSIHADIAGESVLVSKQYPAPGKFSFSMTNSDGSPRVSALTVDLGVQVGIDPDTLEPIYASVSSQTAGSTVNYPADFDYVTNAGNNGYTNLLKNGDARSILNGDVFKGNNDGGADGSALALASMDPVGIDVGPGEYKVTLTGTVKDNSALQNLPFNVTQHVHVILHKN